MYRGKMAKSNYLPPTNGTCLRNTQPVPVRAPSPSEGSCRSCSAPARFTPHPLSFRTHKMVQTRPETQLKKQAGILHTGSGSVSNMQDICNGTLLAHSSCSAVLPLYFNTFAHPEVQISPTGLQPATCWSHTTVYSLQRSCSGLMVCAACLPPRQIPLIPLHSPPAHEPWQSPPAALPQSKMSEAGSAGRHWFQPPTPHPP